MNNRKIDDLLQDAESLTRSLKEIKDLKSFGLDPARISRTELYRRETEKLSKLEEYRVRELSAIRDQLSVRTAELYESLRDLEKHAWKKLGKRFRRALGLKKI